MRQRCVGSALPAWKRRPVRSNESQSSRCSGSRKETRVRVFDESTFCENLAHGLRCLSNRGTTLSCSLKSSEADPSLTAIAHFRASNLPVTAGASARPWLGSRERLTEYDIFPSYPVQWTIGCDDQLNILSEPRLRPRIACQVPETRLRRDEKCLTQAGSSMAGIPLDVAPFPGQELGYVAVAVCPVPVFL